MKNKIAILGYGEVGKAIAKFYENPCLRQNYDGQVKIKNLKRDDGLEGADVLNICIPYSDNFVKILKEEIKKINPKLVIIHSTVAPGTTEEIGRTFKPEIMVVHSPIRGVHPYLYQGIKTFVKYVGADDEKAGQTAKEHLEELGIKVKVFRSSKTTELGKLFSTTYYGLCIAWHGEMKKICDKEGINFEEAVRDFNDTYNQGYQKLGKRNVVRPVLYPPERGIGGHCILPNCQILKKHYKSKAFDLILDYGPEK